jgi:hypothetical protein
MIGVPYTFASASSSLRWFSSKKGLHSGPGEWNGWGTFSWIECKIKLSLNDEAASECASIVGEPMIEIGRVVSLRLADL